MSKIYVLYHASCMDGAGSRYAAWLKFREKALYIPVQYKKPPPPIEDGSEVYILDFSYPKEILEELNARVSKLVVLDHHESAMEQLKNLPYAKFDMAKSGAVLAWEYFHPDKPTPLLLLNVQDRDLWKFNLKNTREIVAGLRKRQDDMNYWDMVVAEQFTSDQTTYPNNSYLYNKIRDTGKTVLDYEKTLIDSAIRNTRVVEYLGYRVGVVNATNVISEIGSAIYEDEKLNVDFSISFFIEVETRSAVLSFRSNNKVNVSSLAIRLGGGGHAGAAGAHVSMDYLHDLLAGKFSHNDTGDLSDDERLQELLRKPWIDHDDPGGPLLHCNDGKPHWLSLWDRLGLKLGFTDINKLNDKYSTLTIEEQKYQLKIFKFQDEIRPCDRLSASVLPALDDVLALRALAGKLADEIADVFPSGTVSREMVELFRLSIHGNIVRAIVHQDKIGGEDVSVSIVDSVLRQYNPVSDQIRYRKACLEKVRNVLKNQKPL